MTPHQLQMQHHYGAVNKKFRVVKTTNPPVKEYNYVVISK